GGRGGGVGEAPQDGPLANRALPGSQLRLEIGQGSSSRFAAEAPGGPGKGGGGLCQLGEIVGRGRAASGKGRLHVGEGRPGGRNRLQALPQPVGGTVTHAVADGVAAGRTHWCPLPSRISW